MTFTGTICRYTMVVVEYLPRTQEKLERHCLQHHFERPLKLCNWSSIQVSLFILLTRGAGIVNVQGCSLHWHLTSYLARLITLTQTHSPSPVLMNDCRIFKEGQHIDL